MNSDNTGPDIFHAAEVDDPAELAAARAEGQSLSDVDPVMGQTPLHVAAMRRSNRFIEAALQDESCDPHAMDANQYRAWDHAYAYNNMEGCRLLNEAMYAHLHAPDDRYIDYSDNEPSEFYPG